MIIFSDYNEPYLFAISFVLLIGIHGNSFAYLWPYALRRYRCSF